MMRLSKYLKIYPDPKDGQGLILFSTKNAAIIEIPKSNFDNIALHKKDRNILKQYGFLVDDPEEERKELLGFIDDLNELNRTLNIKVVMSLDCNLACRYCFEGTRKGKYYMARETADDLIEFVRNKIEGAKSRREGGIDEIRLVFYGGEPLLSRDLIIHIAKKVKSLAKSRRVPFSFYLQTNGTLLTRRTAEELKPLGLKEAYITIDGPKEDHDKSRPYKSGRGSFERIIRNVKVICRIIKVQLGGNFTKDNFRSFPGLLDFLLDNDLTPRRISNVGFFSIVAESSEFANPEFHEGCDSVNEPWLFEAMVFLREEILKRGFPGEKVSPGVCMMEHRNNILVNYDGSIYKCPGLIGRKEFCVGNLKEGISDYRTSHNLDNWKNDKCLDCAYLPLCFGGCRYMKLIRDGNMNGVDCKKPYFDATLEALVMQDIKYG